MQQNKAIFTGVEREVRSQQPKVGKVFLTRPPQFQGPLPCDVGYTSRTPDCKEAAEVAILKMWIGLI